MGVGLLRVGREEALEKRQAVMNSTRKHHSRRIVNQKKHVMPGKSNDPHCLE